jgi:hypothetical protein
LEDIQTGTSTTLLDGKNRKKEMKNITTYTLRQLLEQLIETSVLPDNARL